MAIPTNLGLAFLHRLGEKGKVMSSSKDDYKNIHISGRRGRQNLESELCSGQRHCSVLSETLSLLVLVTPHSHSIIRNPSLWRGHFWGSLGWVDRKFLSVGRSSRGRLPPAWPVKQLPSQWRGLIQIQIWGETRRSVTSNARHIHTK